MRCAVVGGIGVLAGIALATSAMLLLQPRNQFTDRSGHAQAFVQVAPDVSIEVLDWAGSGPSLILLAGGGNTAHVFDHFAHQFTDAYRVVGITRRGYGASTHAPSGYDLATRAQDILAVTDWLGLGQVILVGHSAAGDEMTKFAATYPNRVRALVYLDAAYDRTKVNLHLPQPDFPKPTSDMRSSLQKFNAYSARIWNWRFPDAAETYNTMSVTPDGRIGEHRTAAQIHAQMMKHLEPPEYDKVRAPALALWARPDLRRTYPWYADFTEESRIRAERIVETTTTYQEQASTAFLANSNNRRVDFLDGNHYLFLTNELEVVRLIRRFLTEVLQ